MSTGRDAGARVSSRGWGFCYPGRAEPALREVTFTVQPGELVVLMGASGSGKSTLLAALAGTLPEGRVHGSLAIGVDDPPGSEPARIGLVQQEPEGNIVMQRVGDDVAFPLECAAVPPGRIWPRVLGALGAVGLAVDGGQDTARLSGGQQQLLAVAGACVAGPDLILLDEPTANLDPASAAGVLDAVARVRAESGGTVVVVEHRVEPWLRRADRVLLAEGGSIVQLAPDQVAAHLAVRPESAGRVWLDHSHLATRPPVRGPGAVVLAGRGLSCAGRLTTTDVSARAGEVVALTGAPGSGKSTLLACLAGLLEPTSGTVRVGSGRTQRVDPWTWPSADVAGAFGVVFQNPEHQFVAGRVLDEVQHGLTVAGVPQQVAAQRAGRMLERLHLAHLADANPFTLSGGEQRRLSVGCALALDPGILLLDEPTFGQDPATWTEIVDIIATHRDAGGTVVLATHDPDLVRVLGVSEVHLSAGSADAAVGRGPGSPTGDVGPPPADENRLRRLDPLALLAAAITLSAAALVSASVALNVALAALGRRVALLGAPALVATASVAFSNALLSSGGLADATSWSAAALPASRVLAVALPGLVAAVAIDPTGLADSLVTRLRVPGRPAYSVLAGLRLLPLLADEWGVLARASRARGLGGSGLRSRVRQFTSMVFRLLVAALRRGGRLAVALDARGLRADAPRTIARPVAWSWRDPAALGVALVALGLALSTRVG